MSPKVHSTPSLHDAVFGTCWHPTAGSHVSSVHGFASSQPPAVQRGVVVVLIDMVVEEVLVVDEVVVADDVVVVVVARVVVVVGGGRGSRSKRATAASFEAVTESERASVLRVKACGVSRPELVPLGVARR